MDSRNDSTYYLMELRARTLGATDKIEYLLMPQASTLLTYGLDQFTRMGNMSEVQGPMLQYGLHKTVVRWDAVSLL